MKILALETSAKSVSTAVVENGAPLAYAYQCTGLTHSRTLMPMVDAMLKNAELTLGDMDAVAVAAGPGSFTGLRIGIAAVKGPRLGSGQAVLRRFHARGDGAESRPHGRSARLRDGRAAQSGLQRAL